MGALVVMVVPLYRNLTRNFKCNQCIAMDRQKDAADENGPRMAVQETMFSLNLIFWISIKWYVVLHFWTIFIMPDGSYYEKHCKSAKLP